MIDLHPWFDLEKVKKCHSINEASLSQWMLNHHRDFAISLLKERCWNFKFATNAMKNDREMVMIVVQKSGKLLKYVSEKLRNEIEIVKTAIFQYPKAFKYASESLKSDRNLILFSVAICGFVLQYVTESFKNDREIVVTAIRRNWKSFRYASESLKNDQEIAVIAIQKNGESFKYVSELLKYDRDFIKRSIATNEWAFYFIPKSLKNDKDICGFACRKNIYSLRISGYEYRNNASIMMSHILENKKAIQYVSKRLGNYTRFLSMILKKFGISKYTYIYDFLAEKLTKNRYLHFKLLKTPGFVTRHYTKFFNDRKHIVLFRHKRYYII